MKKMILVLCCAMVASTVVLGDAKPIAFEKLPAKAAQFASKYFPGDKVALASVDSDFLSDKDYEVVFSSGASIDFDGNGEWTNVECRAGVPAGIIPAEIAKYISANYSGRKVVEIDRDKRDWEVKLNNGAELKFDKKFNLIGIDN